ncbi:MAG: carboxypeptidase regulatory-like domain-containing protein [Candidatus Aminicenantes bacterium]|nr:carboxypeptidase regulatory-like domain-containing protein [Candidatus Aminicenantes bacterium]
MKLKLLVLLTILLLVLSPLAFSQSKDTGAVVGKAVDTENEPLPGVTITLSSPNLMGERTFVTTETGEYRFPALPPGVYTVKAELQGFKTVLRENVRVTTTVRLTIDFTMELTALEEEVTVIAESPTVDIKTSETASVTLADEILRNVPYSNFAMDIVNLAPGVTGNVAYGASSDTGIAYQVDGVDVSDPEAGSAWVFVDPNIVEEAKIMGIGANAEYGNFTGVIFNLVTKSGGNEFSGHFEGIFQGDGKRDLDTGEFTPNFWQADNTTDYQSDFPDLTPPGLKLYDFGAHLGGPIQKDKVWFFIGGQYYRSFRKVTGFPEDVDYKQPRGFLKITSQLTSKTSIMAYYEYDAYNGINRDAGATVSAVATVNQKSPDSVGNFSLTHILSPKTFFDLKFAFFTGYYYLDPETGMDVNAHFNENDNMLYDSSGYFFYADRDRYQANASVTHYAEDFIQGNHDFKFGVEFEYGKVRNRYGFTGPNATYYDDLTGYGAYGYYYTGNYLAFQYEGYDTNTRYMRIEEFVQDTWKVSDRLSINLGLRASHMFGTIKDVSGTVYKEFRLAPRIGFTFDILGDKSTVFKAHYGQFAEAMLSSYHDRLNPASAYSDFISSYWDVVGNVWVPYETITHEELYSLDPDLKHPYMDQFTVGIERELFRDASFSVTFIYRNWRNIIGPIDTLATYSPVTVNDPETGDPYTVYEIDDANAHAYVLKNLTEDDAYFGLKPYRKYWGLEFLFNKRFSDKWQLLASYVYSQAKGTLDNAFADDIGWGGATDDPNFWINTEGHSTYDPTHMVKIQGTYILPLDIHLTAYFRAITGNSWTRRYRTQRFNQGRITFLTEPRGSNHYPIYKLLDLRLEKTFMLAEKYRFGFMFDVFNVFNADTITYWGTRIDYDWLLTTDPDYYTSTEGHNLLGIVSPRQVRIGIRLIF